MTLPLAGIRVVEFAGQGPAPFAGGMLADFGADVVILDRGEVSGGLAVPRRFDFLNRNKRSISLDLKSEAGRAAALALAARADVLLEGYRPGVMERLGLGPAPCMAANPRLVYGRMTGWGQDGPLAQTAGHDINYLALTGALAAMGVPGKPPAPPLNLVADFGGGGMYLVAGVMIALHVARQAGRGQVVDCAMIDGVSHMMAMFHAFRQQGFWTDGRQDNALDGGAPYYAVYRTSDDRYVSVGAIEPRFYAALIAGLGLAEADLPQQNDRDSWPDMRERFAAIFAERTLAEWVEIMAGRDACVAPVLTMDEARDHPQVRARGMFRDLGGLAHPGPAPRLSDTPGDLRHVPPEPGADGAAILSDWGLPAELLPD